MSPHVRRIMYVVSYELVAILLSTLAYVLLGFSGGSSGTMAVIASGIALLWNYAWTSAFEAWESRQASRVRTVKRRLAHAIGFELGFMALLVPTMAWILGITLPMAFTLNLGFMVFFLVYTFVFAWLFDRVVPRRGHRSARQ